MNQQEQTELTHRFFFKIGFDILDLIEIIKKHNLPGKTGIALIKYYTGEPLQK